MWGNHSNRGHCCHGYLTTSVHENLVCAHSWDQTFFVVTEMLFENIADMLLWKIKTVTLSIWISKYLNLILCLEVVFINMQVFCNNHLYFLCSFCGLVAGHAISFHFYWYTTETVSYNRNILTIENVMLKIVQYVNHE